VDPRKLGIILQHYTETPTEDHDLNSGASKYLPVLKKHLTRVIFFNGNRFY
jgi:hypothetical protein